MAVSLRRSWVCLGCSSCSIKKRRMKKKWWDSKNGLVLFGIAGKVSSKLWGPVYLASISVASKRPYTRYRFSDQEGAHVGYSKRRDSTKRVFFTPSLSLSFPSLFASRFLRFFLYLFHSERASTPVEPFLPLHNFSPPRVWWKRTRSLDAAWMKNCGVPSTTVSPSARLFTYVFLHFLLIQFLLDLYPASLYILSSPTFVDNISSLPIIRTRRENLSNCLINFVDRISKKFIFSLKIIEICGERYWIGKSWAVDD